MAIYRTINLSFWTDSKIDDDFTPEDKYFFLYLLTNPQTNVCGCYEVSVKQMANQTGYNRDTIERLIKRFEDVHHVIAYSKSTKEILVLNWHKYNWNKSPKVLSAIESVAKHIKCKKFRDYIFRIVDDLKNDRVSIPYTYPMDTSDSVYVSVTDSVTVSDSDSVTDSDSVHNPASSGADPVEELFESLWKLYPRKKDKSSVTKKTKGEIYKIGYDHMVRAIERYKKEIEGKDEKYIKYGSSFFNTNYVDYLDENYVPTKTKTEQNMEMFQRVAMQYGNESGVN